MTTEVLCEPSSMIKAQHICLVFISPLIYTGEKEAHVPEGKRLLKKQKLFGNSPGTCLEAKDNFKSLIDFK